MFFTKKINEDIESIFVFPTPIIHYSNFISEDERNEILNIISNIETFRHPALNGNASSNHNDFSNLFNYFENNLICKNIKNNLLKVLNFYAKNSGLPELKIGNSWFNIQNKHSFLSHHNHPNSILSAALYININEDGSYLQFENPNQYDVFTNFKKDSLASRILHEIKIKNCDLVVFPSWLRHGGSSKENMMDYRVVVSCNSHYL